MNDIQQAREWADRRRNISDTQLNAGVKAAAEVIQSLPDQWIDAEKVREIYDRYRASETTLHEALRAAVALATPPLPTLADMTAEEQEACQWMQAQVFPTATTLGIITGIDGYAHSAIILFADGMAKNVPWDRITPLPDLPKLEWPGSHADTITAESVEDVQAGRVADFEPALPCPEDVPAGEPWIVEYEDREWVGVRKSGTGSFPWSLASMDGRTRDCAFDSVITLVSRLVPEPVVKTLHTVEDYEAAAIGTVVRRQELPWLAATFHKCVDGIWDSTGAHEYPSSEMAGTARTVLWEPKP